MLTADLAQSWYRNGKTGPRLIDAHDPELQRTANDLVALVQQHLEHTRAELETALEEYIGTGTGYRILRGLIKLLLDRCEFATPPGISAAELRETVFLAARTRHPVIARGGLREEALHEAAEKLSLTVETVGQNLYADLPERQVLLEFEETTASALLHRYNLAQAQALLYRCGRLELRLEPHQAASRRHLFNAIKHYRLIHRVTGNPADGYEIVLDGPVSLFHRSQKYGIQMAAFLPALLLCEGWQMRADIEAKDGRRAWYELDSAQNRLTSHYLAGFNYEPEARAKLQTDWAKLKNGWTLAPTTQLIHVGAAVFIPDLVLRDETGREIFVEVAGFWTPHSLQERGQEFARGGFHNFVVLVSDELRGTREAPADLPPHVLNYKNVIDAKALALLVNGMEWPEK